MTAAGAAKDDRALGIDGDDPDAGIALFECARHAGDRSRRADTDEDIVERVEPRADFTRREPIVRIHGVGIAVLARSSRRRNTGAQIFDPLQACQQEPAGSSRRSTLTTVGQRRRRKDS